jgi:glycosyltransferase involved in cell wall biosynthesis
MNILYHHRTQAQLAEGVHIREIVKALEKLKHRVFVVSPPGINLFFGNNTEKTTLTSKTGFWHWISRNMPEGIFEMLELSYNITAYFNITRTLRHNINLIYERYAFFCLIGALVARAKRIPYILEVNEVSGIKRTRSQIFVGIAKRIEQFVFNKADAIIVVSQFLKEHITGMGIENSRIHVIPNGVDTKTFNPQVPLQTGLKETINPNHKTVIGFTGSFVKWHNFAFLLETFSEILKEYGERVILLLVGDGPMRNEIEASLEALNLHNHVYLTGSVGHSSIPAYLQLMDICIIPHSNEFRSPIKLFEYMAMGKAVVACDAPPIKAVIEDGKNGLLFQANVKASLKEAVFLLLNDASKRNEIGRNAFHAAIEKYLWKNNANKIIDIYAAIGRNYETQ